MMNRETIKEGCFYYCNWNDKKRTRLYGKIVDFGNGIKFGIDERGFMGITETVVTDLITGCRIISSFGEEQEIIIQALFIYYAPYTKMRIGIAKKRMKKAGFNLPIN